MGILRNSKKIRNGIAYRKMKSTTGLLSIVLSLVKSCHTLTASSILSVYLRSLFLLLLHWYSRTPPTPHEQMTSQLQQLYLSHLTTLLDYTNLSRKTPRYGDKTHSSQQNKLKRCNLFSISKNYVWHLKCCIALNMLWKIQHFCLSFISIKPISSSDRAE